MSATPSSSPSPPPSDYTSDPITERIKTTTGLSDLNVPLSDLSATTLATLARCIPDEACYPLAVKLNLPEPLRYHVDNLLEKDVSYQDVQQCISFMSEIRKGTLPTEIPGLIDFMIKQPMNVKKRFLVVGETIQLKLLQVDNKE